MRTPDFLKVDERKLTEWMRDTLLALKRNPNRVHWFDLFHDDVEDREYAVVMGVNDDYDEGSGVTAKVAYAPDNRIIMDYDDFEMPYDPETGEVDDTDTTIAMLDDVTDGNVADFVSKNEVKWLLDAAKQFYKEYKEKESRMEESRRPRNRMLKESSIDWSRMPTIPQDQIDAVEDEIRQKYNTWDERTQESADMVLNALDCVNGEIESCKANKDLGEDLELIVDAIRGGGYSEISLLDLDNEIDTSALEDFIADVLDKNESRRPRGRMLRERDEDGVRSVEDFIEDLEDLRLHSKNLTQKQYAFMIELTNFLKQLTK